MIVHYQNALMRPQVSVLHYLRARPDLDHHQRPIVTEGSRSLVAKLRRSDGVLLALRIPKDGQDATGWSEQYAGLRRLALTTLKGRLPVRQRCSPRGSSLTRSVRCRRWPWTGCRATLATAVQRACQTGNSGVLRALASAVVDLVNSFRAAGFAHQHLSPDNLIISTSGALVAVGLDEAAWWEDRRLQRGSGAPAYSHPDGNAFGSDSDAFAALVLFASLRVPPKRPTSVRSMAMRTESRAARCSSLRGTLLIRECRRRSRTPQPESRPRRGSSSTRCIARAWSRPGISSAGCARCRASSLPPAIASRLLNPNQHPRTGGMFPKRSSAFVPASSRMRQRGSRSPPPRYREGGNVGSSPIRGRCMACSAA